MRRWVGPALVGLVSAAVAHQVVLLRTPRFLMAQAMGRIQAAGGPNAFLHAPRSTSTSRAVVRTSPDLAYSGCLLDLSRGPVAVTVPPMPAPYWSLAVYDAATDAVFVRNGEDARGEPIAVVLALADQVVPDGLDVVRMPDATGVAVLRILLEDDQDFPKIDRARRRASCGRRDP